MIASITFAVVVPSESRKICFTANVPAPVVLAIVLDRERDAEREDVAEDRRDDDRHDDRRGPPPREAPCVSSLMCAEAS